MQLHQRAFDEFCCIKSFKDEFGRGGLYLLEWFDDWIKPASRELQ